MGVPALGLLDTIFRSRDHWAESILTPPWNSAVWHAPCPRPEVPLDLEHIVNPDEQATQAAGTERDDRVQACGTNDSIAKVDAFYFNIDYRSCSKPLPTDTLYVHAQYRQATPAHGWTNNWSSSSDSKVNDRPNLSGEDNYVWLDARGQGHFVGVTKDA
jgi:hypothetical protein